MLEPQISLGLALESGVLYASAVIAKNVPDNAVIAGNNGSIIRYY